jgi:hypothetical protein
MAYKLGDMAHTHMSLSKSLHRLHNIIADDEISNRKYSDEDKIIVQNMQLNGRVIGGLVTEDHRKDWLGLTLEEMYDKVCEEIEEIQDKILAGRSIESLAADDTMNDPVSNSILGTYIYTDTTGESSIPGDLEELIKNDFKVGSKKLRKEVTDLIKEIFDALVDKPMDDAKLEILMKKIALSSPVKKVDLFDDEKVVLHTPEEKLFAIEILKKYKSEYTLWYEKVLHEMGLDSLSEDQLKQLLDIVKD